MRTTRPICKRVISTTQGHIADTWLPLCSLHNELQSKISEKAKISRHLPHATPTSKSREGYSVLLEESARSFVLEPLFIRYCLGKRCLFQILLQPRKNYFTPLVIVFSALLYLRSPSFIVIISFHHAIDVSQSLNPRCCNATRDGIRIPVARATSRLTFTSFSSTLLTICAHFGRMCRVLPLLPTWGYVCYVLSRSVCSVLCGLQHSPHVKSSYEARKCEDHWSYVLRKSAVHQHSRVVSSKSIDASSHYWLTFDSYLRNNLRTNGGW